ncbi:serine hydrolase domain-containing protein [Aestuariivivens sediminicola]|uniref:serine hydrolase domain-containing protein n=1 Tax=Aestuariivivens sediminicola TaxID=2913560 RepID=UPI001F560DBA|nr:serine hydrolase [Aestuariivivens sediminicola]
MAELTQHYKKNPIKNAAAIFAMVFTLAHMVYAQDDWTYNTNPSASGWDTSDLEELNEFIIDSTVVTGLMIVHNGAVVFDYGDIEENSYIASCRKSVLAMLYGKYVDNATIDLNKTIEELGIDDVEGLLPIEKKATIEDLITARSGVYHPEGYAGGWQELAPKRGSVEPGSYWLYNNWDFNVAGFVFEQETHKNIYDEIEDQLAIPLGMEDWDRSIQIKQGDTTKSRYLAYPMDFSTRDMAKIGQLMLQKGEWHGKQIISEKWINKMIQQRTSYKELNTNAPYFRNSGVNFGYGYMWWLFEDMNDPKFNGAYAALGAMGQAIAIFPEIDVVAVYKTKETYERVNSFQVRLDIIKKIVDLYHPN